MNNLLYTNGFINNMDNIMLNYSFVFFSIFFSIANHH